MSTIQKTTNYDQFKFFESNRIPCPNYLVLSIKEKNMLHANPIVCDRDMYVIDGQNRLQAAQILGVPIYYQIVDDLGEEDIGRFQIQNKWDLQDFLKFHKNEEPYKVVNTLLELYRFPLHFLISKLSNQSLVTKKFKKGELVLVKNLTIVKEKLKFLFDFKSLVSSMKKDGIKIDFKDKIIKSLYRVISRPDYNHDKFFNKCVKNSRMFVDCFKYNDELLGYECLLKIYNLNSRTKNSENE